jgi:hypothetical protein
MMLSSWGIWLRAVVVQHLAATHAQRRLERTARIVDARVYHFAVAGTRADADGFRRFQHDHFTSASSQRTRDGKTDDTSADHHTFDLIHVRWTRLEAPRSTSSSTRISIACGVVETVTACCRTLHMHNAK